MDIEATYAGLVSGDLDRPNDMDHGPQLSRRALQDTRNPDPVARLGALRVAGLLGTDLAISVTRALVDDPDERVRIWAFNQALAARDVGLGVIRDAAHGRDPNLVAASLELLDLRMDRPSAGVGRRGLDHEDARVRLAAARLLGRVAGPAVTVQLRNAAALDDDPAVRAAAAKALEQVGGALPRGEPSVWWDADAPVGGIPTPSPGDPSMPQLAWRGRQTDSEDPLPLPAPPQAAEPAKALPVPAPQPEPPAEPEPAWNGQYAALPESMPTETRALLRLVGMVSPADRGAVLPLLAGVTDLGDHVGAWRRGSDVALARGVALAVAGLQRQVALTTVRRMIDDPHLGVRAAAAEAIGALGGASLLPSLAGLLDDSTDEVRIAAARGLAQIGIRSSRREYARDALSRIGEQPEAVAAAVATALAELRDA